jgi:RNA polymerase sigma-70 factor (ECF subfamily)
VERYRPKIEFWCGQLGLQSADADDVQGRVLASLVTAMKEFNHDPARRFRGWLRAVVNNAVRNLRREQGRNRWTQGSGDDAVQEQIENVPTPDPIERLAEELDDCLQYELRQVHRIVTYVEQRVEPHTWQAFWQTAIDDKAAAEVARNLNMTVAAVYMAKSRVTNMLRKAAVLFSPSPGSEL